MILVDTNVILDVLEDDPKWGEWSAGRLDENDLAGLAINPMIYAELCPSSESNQELDSRLAPMGFKYLEIPHDGLFLASAAYQTYRKNKGTRDSLLPDFLIGGHAEASAHTILTRDPRRYRTYFPKVPLIVPDPE